MYYREPAGATGDPFGKTPRRDGTCRIADGPAAEQERDVMSTLVIILLVLLILGGGGGYYWGGPYIGGGLGLVLLILLILALMGRI
jgi:hypothetical protein